MSQCGNTRYRLQTNQVRPSLVPEVSLLTFAPLLVSGQCPIGSWPADPRLRKLGQFARLVLESDAEGM
jgi:hypothetical protein